MLFNNLIILIVFTWLAGITFLGFRFWRFFQNLTKEVSDKDLKTLLEGVLKEVNLVKEEREKLISRFDKLEKESELHFKKFGLVRYNPFSDTGGDQSFVLAILDNHDDGVVITSLHSREQTRVFAKPVTAGKESGYEFSKEEIEAIVRAKKGKQIK